MAKKYYQFSSLDVNLWVDRAANTIEDLDLQLEIPDDIKFGETDIVMRIINYDPFYKYEVSCAFGTARVEDDLIYYSAPPEPNTGDDTLTVVVTVEPRSIAYFPNGYNGKDYFYDDEGAFSYVDDYLNDPDSNPGYHEFLKTIRKENEKMMADAKLSAPVITTEHNQPTGETLDGGEFRIDSMFAEYAFMSKSWSNDGFPVGGEEFYHLPSDIDLSPNYESYLYQVKNGSYTFKSRNSNTGEAHGNTNDGYRFPGAIGSSLSVINTGNEISKGFDFLIPINLYPLEAIVPPEILSLCISSVEITPILRGIPDGHTFLWEQISGDESQVVWISDRTDKDLIINIGSIKSDRVFRFWISKGTKYEKRYDVVIYGTPKDEISGIPNAGNHFNISGTNLNLHNHETKPLLLTASRMWLKDFRVTWIDKIR